MASIRCPVKEASLISQHEPAILVKDRRFIYSEYDQYVSVTTERFRAMGVTPGERVALMVADQWQLAVLMMALFRAGGVACPLSPWTKSADLAALLQGMGCRRIVGAGADAATVPDVRAYDPEDVVAFFAETTPEESGAMIPMEQPATLFTSVDATGRSRVVAHSYGSLYYGAKGFNHGMRASSHSRWLLLSPLWTQDGFCTAFRCAMSGGTLVIPGTRQPVVDAVEEYGVTHLFADAAVVEGLLSCEKGEDVLSTLGVILVDAPEVPRGLVERGKLWNIKVCCSFSLPEMGPYVTLNRPDAAPDKRHGAGPVLKYAEVQIAPDGEILVRGQMLFDGYLEQGNIRRPLTADGWFATGRKGGIDESGCLLVTK